MQIDGFTVVVCGFLIRTLLALLFLVLWVKDRHAIWFAWWSAAFFLGDVTALFYLLHEYAGVIPPAGFEAASLILAFGCCWQAARAFEGRAPLLSPVLAALVVWLFACLIPGFLDNAAYRVVLSSALIGPIAAMSAVEFWRGREERLPSRWGIIALFGSMAAIFVSRIPLVGLLPFPFGALPMEPNWLSAFSLILILHTAVLAVLVVAMTRERLEREQQLKAQTDSLTGALNRRAFMTYAERLLSRHERGRKPLCLVLFDIDQFKSLNDRFGHIGGDEILTRFVAITEANLRPDDFLFRLGGDEFCWLLPDTDIAEAYAAAERVCDGIADSVMVVAGAPVKLTASMGVASTETFGYALDPLMREADTALYAAKAAGRNRVAAAAAGVAAETGSQAFRPGRRVALGRK